MKTMQIMEAVASVSMSHPQACACKVCLAAGGDVQALADVMADVAWSTDGPSGKAPTEASDGV